MNRRQRHKHQSRQEAAAQEQPVTPPTPPGPPDTVNAIGYGNPLACGQYTKADMWNGYPLYLNASGYCLVYDGNGGWVIWNGDVRVGGAIQSQYNKPGTNPTGSYGLSNGAAPAGTVS